MTRDDVQVSTPRQRTPNKGRAFVTGGIGCLGAFLVIGLLFVLLGGTMYIDIGGAILLLLIGGVVGLIVNWIYQRGRRDASAGGVDAAGTTPGSRDERSPGDARPPE